jgi:ABC-type sugar transport system ATPase subunit
MTSAAPYVRIDRLVRQFPGVRALDGASLDVAEGEVVGLLGKNGAGKSSLIKILAGLDRADSGEVLVGGRPVPTGYDARAAHSLRLAFVHQELNNVPGMTVAENVTLGGRYPRRAGLLINRPRMRREVGALLERLDILVGVDDLVGDLSSTQQRLVMIARALHHDARILVLDEPTVSFTHVEVDHLHKVVRQLRDTGHGIVYVSHRLSEVKKLTDRIVVMQNGRVVMESGTRAVSESDMIAAITGTRSSATRPASIAAPETRANAVPALRLTGLVTPRVRDVSFDLHYGEILGLAGLVGSGRSEIVRAIFGADARDAGDIEVAGVRVRIAAPIDAVRSGIGLLPEDRRRDGLIQDFSVRANVTLASLRRHSGPVLRVARKSRERIAVQAVAQDLAISMAGPEAPVGNLSGGNQQKVVVAKWLEARSQILIFDEPTQGVDVGAREDIFRLMEELAASGKAVLVISSDFSELIRVCTRVIGIREGRLTGELSQADINDQNLVRLAYAGL